MKHVFEHSCKLLSCPQTSQIPLLPVLVKACLNNAFNKRSSISGIVLAELCVTSKRLSRLTLSRANERVSLLINPSDGSALAAFFDVTRQLFEVVYTGHINVDIINGYFCL